MLAQAAENFYSLPYYWRAPLLLLPALVLGFFINRPVYYPLREDISLLEQQINQAKSRVAWYRENRAQVDSLSYQVQSLSQQVDALRQNLAESTIQGPQQFYITAALKSGVVPDHVQTLEITQDEYGRYARTSVKVHGTHGQTGRFFEQILAQKQLVVWERLELELKNNPDGGAGLSLYLLSRHYLELYEEEFEHGEQE